MALINPALIKRAMTERVITGKVLTDKAMTRKAIVQRGMMLVVTIGWDIPVMVSGEMGTILKAITA